MVVSCSGRDLLLEVVIVVCFLLLIHRDILVVAICSGYIQPIEITNNRSNLNKPDIQIKSAKVLEMKSQKVIMFSRIFEKIMIYCNCKL